MAKATVKGVKQIVSIESVTLELTQEEVAFLMTILYRVGGSPDTSYRKFADRIIAAIYNDDDASIKVELNTNPYSIAIDENMGRPGSIYFKDGSLPETPKKGLAF